MVLARGILQAIGFLLLPVLIVQVPPGDDFRNWARRNAHPVQLSGNGAGARDLAPLRGIAGSARILGFGEPTHSAHEVLTMRNRVIQYAVSELGVRAIAMETGLAKSKRLYDHVLGRSNDTDATLRSLFSYGFGDFPENLELVSWLRNRNASNDSSQAVRLYGIDLTGQLTASASPALLEVFEFLDRADAATSKALRTEFADTTRSLDRKRYPLLEEVEKDAITSKIQDLIGLLRRRGPKYIAATSFDDYDWAVQSAINAAQDAAFLRLMPRDFWDQMARGGPGAIEPTPRWRDFLAMREVAMVENFSWIMTREATRGRVFVFAANGHLQKHEHRSDRVKSLDGLAAFGMYAHAKFGSDYVVIGTYFGTGEGFAKPWQPAPPHLDGIDGLLGSVALPAFIVDLRQLPRGPLSQWFSAGHATRSGSFGEWIESVEPARAFDSILYIDKVTPHPPFKRSP